MTLATACPKPEPRRKKKRKGVKRVNVARKEREFRRCYHSKERVAWVQRLACLVCLRRPSENAHTKGGGGSRKAGYETIVPLCHDDHARYDAHDPQIRAAFDWAAKALAVQVAWLRTLVGSV